MALRFSPSYQSKTPAHSMMAPTLRVSLSNSLSSTWKCLDRHTFGCSLSMGMLNPIKLKNQDSLSSLIHVAQRKLELCGEDVICKPRSPMFTVYCPEDKLV